MSSGYPTKLICCLIICVWATAGRSEGAEAGYKSYKDPGGRFAFVYPATMKVDGANPDEVKIYHPRATLRISVFIEKRPRKRRPKVGPLIAAFKKRLRLEMKGASIVEEGKLPGSGDSQGYLICSFQDQREIKHVQLVQWFVGEERVLQMIVSDRARGFRNLEKVIRKIHRSLMIGSPGIK